MMPLPATVLAGIFAGDVVTRVAGMVAATGVVVKMTRFVVALKVCALSKSR